MERKNVAAVILMAGNSSRFGKGYNKNFEKIYDKPVFLYSVEAFEKNKNISSIILVVKREEMEIIKKQIIDRKEKEILVILGGSSRKESVTNALSYVKTKDVIIQDGARPNIKQEYINKCIEVRRQYKGCAIAIKSKDTVKITDDNGIVVQTTNRKNTWLVQTPQCFEKEVLWKVHQKNKNIEITDDCMLLELEGYKVKLIEGEESNRKITTQQDVEILEKYLKNKAR